MVFNSEKDCYETENFNDENDSDLIIIKDNRKFNNNVLILLFFVKFNY